MTTMDHEQSLAKLKAERSVIAAQLQAKDDEINQLIEAHKEQMLQKTRATIKEYNLSPTDLFGSGTVVEPLEQSVRKSRIKYSVPRYIGEKGEEWYGTGTHPQWLVTALASGKKKEELENPEWTRLYGSDKGKKKTTTAIAPDQAAA
ncbi:H-NS histone family protein [bacterium]|nr:H-NS histone family protein [bacterium]